MGIRKHLRLLSVLLVGLAGAGLLTVGLGLTPLSGSVFGSMFGFGPKGDFSLSSNSPVTVTRDQTGTLSLTVTSINHLSGDVSVTATLATSASTPPVVSISQSSVKLAADAAGFFSVTISTTSSTSLGYYNITVQGRAGTISHSITVSADVAPPPPPPTPDFYLSSNTSLLTTTQGTSATATLTISSILSYSGNVALTATVYPSGTNSPTVSLNLTNLKLPGGGANATTVIANAFNATVGYYTIIITGTSGTLGHTISVGLSVTVGTESLYLEFYSFNSSTNTTLYLQNFGSAVTSLVAYYVTDAYGDQYSLTFWNGPTLSPSQVRIATILIGSSCGGCVLSGSAFAFAPSNTYTITLVTSYNNQFYFTVTTSVREALSMEFFGFTSGTNVTLDLRNVGTVPVQLVSYYVKDASGDQYALVSYPGPYIPVNSLAMVFVRIGSSCPGCTLTGTAFTFTAGYSYTITFVTSRNNQFTFTVVR
jgi:hypothetical protein